jgi:uncharacterized membrane protein
MMDIPNQIAVEKLMVQLVTIVLCAYLGWKRAPFYRWPLLVVAVAYLLGSFLTLAMGGGHTGPFFNALLRGFVVSLVAIPLAAYWLAWCVQIVILRRQSR